MNTPRFPGRAGYTKSRCCAGAPRLPTSGSELSLLILVSMLPSSTIRQLLIPSSFTGDTAFIYMQLIRHSQDPHHSPLSVGETFRG